MEDEQKAKQVVANCAKGKNVYVVPIAHGRFPDATLENLARDAFCSMCSDSELCHKLGKVVRKNSVRATRVRLMRALKTIE